MKRVIIILMSVIFISGCTQLGGLTSLLGGPQTVTKEEKVLKPQQGLGVTQYSTAVPDMLAGTYNYVLMSVRNHAGGANAKNVFVSLENVKPFKIQECNADYEPTLPRTQLCNQFYNDWGIPFKAHFVNEMYPDEELQFFWNVLAPTESEIAGMEYKHNVYYTLTYDYAMLISKTIAGISQDEFLRLSQSGPIKIEGSLLSSAGEIKVTSRFQEPFIYETGLRGGLTNINLEFDVSNQGEGLPTPGKQVIVAIRVSRDVTVDEVNAARFRWVPGTAVDNELYRELKLIYPELKTQEASVYVRTILSNDLNSGTQRINLPVIYDSSDFNEPQKFITFNVYIIYNYLKEGSTSIGVYPIK